MYYGVHDIWCRYYFKISFNGYRDIKFVFYIFKTKFASLNIKKGYFGVSIRSNTKLKIINLIYKIFDLFL
jgi:hypothetical protein